MVAVVAVDLDLPLPEPPLAVQWARVAGHVRRKLHRAPAELKSTIPNAVDVRHEREAGRVEDIFQAIVAFPQYWLRGVAVDPLEIGN